MLAGGIVGDEDILPAAAPDGLQEVPGTGDQGVAPADGAVNVQKKEPLVHALFAVRLRRISSASLGSLVMTSAPSSISQRRSSAPFTVQTRTASPLARYRCKRLCHFHVVQSRMQSPHPVGGGVLFHIADNVAEEIGGLGFGGQQHAI